MRAFLTRLLHIARRRRYLAIWSAGLLVIVLVIAAAYSPFSPLDRLNALVFDTYQRLKPRESTESAVAVVDIDDESIRQLGQWPWSRTVLASVIDRLAAEGAAAIGLDIILSEPDRTSPALAVAQLESQGFQVTYPGSASDLDHDRILAASFAKAPVVAGLVLAEGATTQPPSAKAGFAFAGENPAAYLPSFPGAVRNLPVLDEATPGLGVFSFPRQADGVVRQIPLISRQGDNLYPALSIESLRVAQGASSFVIKSTGASGEFDTGQPGMTALKVGEFEVPTGPDGRIWVYYTGEQASPLIPVHRLLGGPDPDLSSQIEGRIVLIGTSAVGLRDLVATPLSAGFPGVLVHAAIIDQIVTQKFLTRPDWAIGFEIVVAIGLGLLVLAFLPWLSTFANAVVAAGALAISVGVGWLAFTGYDLLLSPILPAQTCLLAYGVGSGVRLLLSESEGRYIRSAFSHYLSPAMVEQLVENPDALVLGGENRELTILFCDIRSFTSISETMEPTELTVFLNNFLTPMTNVLMESGATIDKYIGDAIMAFWNAPLDVPEHRQRACESVLKMLDALEKLNQTLEKPVKIGVGLNSGICCVGNLGSRQRFDYSAIGDSVNVGSRIEGLTKQYGVSNLIAESTARGVQGLAMLEIDKVMVVGRDEATLVYTLLGGRERAQDEEFIELKRLHDRFLANYRSMCFDAAANDLALLMKAAPHQLEKVYSEYQRRLDAYLVTPPAAGWDGSYRAEHK
ncbi:adenylate/guanylate cyclase domain-containing protein [Mesorhizobium sp. KR9-304]|uniref:CHASE2 domain-containing protein n=1 Tax=Mesorhizobium sp. KR9-304 TaxID=3156614 RepID=UPI0032B59945